MNCPHTTVMYIPAVNDPEILVEKCLLCGELTGTTTDDELGEIGDSIGDPADDEWGERFMWG